MILACTAIGTISVIVAGMLATRRILSAPPSATLRELQLAPIKVRPRRRHVGAA